MRAFFVIAVCLFLVSCGGIAVEDVPYALPQDSPQDAQPAPIGISKVRLYLPRGSTIASFSAKGLTGLITCEGPYDTIRQSLVSRHFINEHMLRQFTDTLKGQGYDVTGDPGRMFDEIEDLQRTALGIGARVVDLKMDMCRKTTFWFGFDRGYLGEAEMQVDWTVYDMLNRRKVLETTTKGYAKVVHPDFEGIEMLLEEAFAAAAHNLGADQEFHDLVFYGLQPENTPSTIPDPDEDYVTHFNPDEKVVLAKHSPSIQSASGRLEDIMRSTVMVEAGGGHGSGFFVTKQGHILTNAHVVGDALKVRVVTSKKKKKLIAEVLRVDRRRDVALIKLQEIPKNLTIKLLPIRTAEAKIGEDVYAIGAPRLKKLQDTITSGIVSAHRFDRRLKQSYIQADVDIYGGNSGGPLIDANGNVIGIAVLGYIVGGVNTLGGLNWFIPIEDALEKMDIAFE